MNKRIFVLTTLLLALVTFSCNKESTYTVSLKNFRATPVRVLVKYDQSLAAPGQNTLKLDQVVYPGQTVEVYYNKGLGIELPTMKDNDTLLQYTVQVFDEDSVPSLRNYRSLNSYSLVAGSDEKKKLYYYEAKVTDFDFAP